VLGWVFATSLFQTLFLYSCVQRLLEGFMKLSMLGILWDNEYTAFTRLSNFNGLGLKDFASPPSAWISNLCSWRGLFGIFCLESFGCFQHLPDFELTKRLGSHRIMIIKRLFVSYFRLFMVLEILNSSPDIDHIAKRLR
jgi:hypothetical protein